MNTQNDIIALELQKIGLTLREAKVYLIVLQNDNCPVKLIVDTIGCTRPTAHRTLQNLLEKELVEERGENQHAMHYTAKSPDELLSLLHIRKRILEEQERELLRIVAQLRQRDTKTRNEIVTFGHGPEGLRALYERLALTDALTIYTIITDAAHLDYTKLTHTYAHIIAQRGKVVIHECIHRGSKIPAPSIKSIRRHIITEELSIPDGYSMIIADHTTLITDDEIVIIESSHVAKIQRRHIAHFISNEL